MSRYRVKNYTISGQTIALTDFERITIDDIRLIVDETVPAVICSSMQKSNVVISNNVITVPKDVCTLGANDALTIEVDFADSPAGDKTEIITEIGNAKTAIQGSSAETLTSVKGAVTDALTTLQGAITTLLSNIQGADRETLTSVKAAVAAAQTAIIAAMPTDYAIQGANADATNTAILQKVAEFATGMHLVRNEDGEDTYTLVLDKSASVSGTTLNA